MDEIHNFCKENNIPVELKSSLQKQIDTKIRNLKCEEAVDLSINAEKKDTKLSEQLQALANNAPAIQPKNGQQNGTINQPTMTQNTNVQIIQRPSHVPNGQVTVLCQKEPSTYVLVPAAAICQQIQIPSASQGYPIIVQNSAPTYEIKQTISDRNGHVNHLPTSGQFVMLPNSSPVLSTNTNFAIGPRPVISGNILASSPSYFSPITTSLASFPGKICSASSSNVTNQIIPIPMESSVSSNAHRINEFQNEAGDSDTMWRPW